MDNLSPKQRSATMARVRSKNTAPEIVVRRLLHGLGFRYRLHRRDIPGNPDIAFIGRRKAIFVHGCFWHQHDCRRGNRQPGQNTDYWTAKLRRNVERDRASLARLEELGWKSLVVWECEVRELPTLRERLRSFLEG